MSRDTKYFNSWYAWYMTSHLKAKRNCLLTLFAINPRKSQFTFTTITILKIDTCCSIFARIILALISNCKEQGVCISKSSDWSKRKIIVIFSQRLSKKGLELPQVLRLLTSFFFSFFPLSADFHKGFHRLSTPLSYWFQNENLEIQISNQSPTLSVRNNANDTTLFLTLLVDGNIYPDFSFTWVSTVAQMTCWWRFQLIDIETVTVTHSDVSLPLTTTLIPVETRFNRRNSLRNSGMMPLKPTRCMRSAGVHGNTRGRQLVSWRSTESVPFGFQFIVTFKRLNVAISTSSGIISQVLVVDTLYKLKKKLAFRNYLARVIST